MTTRRLFLALLAAPWMRTTSRAAAMPRIIAYRVDAIIVLFSRPIFTRTGVGEGVLYCHEDGAGPERRLRFAFAAGSMPERARGLNRFGYFSESIRVAEDATEQAQYFGFMTRSDEKNLSEAQRSLHASAGGVPVVVIGGESGSAHHASRLASLELQAGADWPVWPACLAAAAQALGGGMPPGVPSRGVPGAETFLRTLSRLLERDDPKGETAFVYGQNPRRLAWRRTPDEKTGRELAARRLLEPGRRVMRFEAEIINQATNGRSRFTIWHDPEARPSLPLRIELQPRSFLRLRLEAVPADDGALRAEMERSFDAWLGAGSAVLRSGL